MSMANRVLLWLLAALVILGISWYTVWFLNNFEQQVEKRRVEVSPEAQRNMFLAAERYLTEIGYDTESFGGRDLTATLPPVTDAMLVRRIDPEMTEQQLYQLNDWVEAGGTLIVSPLGFSDDNSNNLFFQDLGVSMNAREAQDECADGGCDETIKNAPAESDESPETVNKVDDQQTLYDQLNFNPFSAPHAVTVEFRNDRYLVDRDSWATERFGTDQQWNYLRYEIGRGQVVVLSDLDLFSNKRIGNLDNAWLLSDSVTGSRKVWLQYSIDMLPLPQLLWQRMPFVVLAFALLLLFMGWRLLLYTGPRLELVDRQRRNILEHIEATAAYAWRIDRGYALFESNRQSLEKAWRKRHPVLNRMSEAERGAWIGEKTGMTGLAVERSLYHPVNKDLDFIKATLVLQQLASGLKQRELR